MRKIGPFKKQVITLLACALMALSGYGCDGDGSGGGVCTETIQGIGSTSKAKLYYPCNISGPVGATTMSGGFMERLATVEWLSNDIARAGYVVLAFTPSNPLGMVSQWRDAHKNCIEKLKSFNASHERLKGKIDTGKLSTCGHSKGGGGSLWASSELRGELATTVGMAPWMEEFSPDDLGTISAATFIQAGANDTLAINAMTRKEYGGLSSSIDKCYYEYSDMGHMAWANASGETATTLSGDIIQWMNYYMNGQGSLPAVCSGGGSNAAPGGCK